MGGQNVGARKRRFRQVKRQDPTVDQWAEALATAGKDGGCQATEVARGGAEDPLPVAGDVTAEIRDGEDGDDEAVSLRILQRLLRMSKNNRSVPQGRIIKEVWQYLLAQNTSVARIIMQLLCEIRVTGRAPKRWHVSQTAQLDKNNDKAGTKAVRLINMLCPLGK